MPRVSYETDELSLARTVYQPVSISPVRRRCRDVEHHQRLGHAHSPDRAHDDCRVVMAQERPAVHLSELKRPTRLSTPRADVTMHRAQDGLGMAFRQ